jgi:hypothetical protein
MKTINNHLISQPFNIQHTHTQILPSRKVYYTDKLHPKWSVGVQRAVYAQQTFGYTAGIEIVCLHEDNQQSLYQLAIQHATHTYTNTNKWQEMDSRGRFLLLGFGMSGGG